MHLAIKALSSASYRHATETKETNISNKRNIVKNPNWQEADQWAIYKAWPRIWTQDYREKSPASGRGEALNPGPPDYNTSALNHSATSGSGETMLLTFVAHDWVFARVTLFWLHTEVL